MKDIKILNDPDAVASEAARWLFQRVEASPRRFSLALSGGSTPKLFHRCLAENYRGTMQWAKLEIFFSDERIVPLDHEDSNYRMAQETLLNHVELWPQRVHPFEVDKAPDLAARNYEEKLRSSPGGLIDLCILGMGNDGHTASLFPGHSEPPGWVSVIAEPGPGKHKRLSFTYNTLQQASEVLILATGEKKAEMLKRVLETSGDLPMQKLLLRRAENTTFLIDKAAAKLLEQSRR